MNEQTVLDLVGGAASPVPFGGEGAAARTGVSTGDGPMTKPESAPRPHPRARARRSDPETSHEAAAAISRAVEDEILVVFSRGLELTDDELCGRLPQRHPPTVKSARSRLANDGYVADTGVRRPSARGRRSAVWARARGRRVEVVRDRRGRVA